MDADHPLEEEILVDYDSLAEFDGEPGEFWGKLCEFAWIRLEVKSVCLLVGGAAEGAEVRVLSQTPPGAARRVAQAGFASELPKLQASEFESVPGPAGGRFHVLALLSREGRLPLWMITEGLDRAALGEDVVKSFSKEVRSLSDIYQARRHARRSDEKLLTVTEVLDLGLALGESTKFQEAALRVCNELAAPMRASRISLAWIDGQDLKLKATSHGGRVSANSEETLALQQVMEEATDQDNEVSYPEISGASAISREHRQFSIAREGEAILSVPLRHPSDPVGALCLERTADEGKWQPGEIEQVRLLADLVAARLEELHSKSGWIGKRIWRGVRRKAAGFVGTEHTAWKLAAIVVLVTFVITAVVKVEHKVRAPFILKTNAAALISAPFPGFIDQVHYHLGDVVKKGQPLVELDRKDLLLEEADNVALWNKNDREARAFQGEGNLAGMLVAEAEMKQAEARLALIRHRLEHTRLVAPFDGVVVEGDLRERLSSPVKSGDLLLKVAQVKDLFGQLQVDDRDVSYLASESVGELAFTSRPGEKIPVKLERFEPVAELRQEGSVFLLRAQVLEDPQSWWRPGMSGVCKINAGKRSLLWIGCHRMVETLRLWLWV